MSEIVLKTVPKSLEVIKPPSDGLSSDQWQGFIKNLIYFTTPVLGVFFAQLALGIEYRAAGLVALIALYGALADFFKKYNDNKPYLREK